MSAYTYTEPMIVERSEQPYVAIRRSVTMETFGAIADRIPEVLDWLASRGVEPAGAVFFRYNVVDMPRLVVEAGVPVAAVVATEGDVISGVLPAGRYVTVTHVGHPDELLDVTATLLRWAEQQDLDWDMADAADGQRWGCRLEVYKTDPSDEPDLNKWETDLAFRLAD